MWGQDCCVLFTACAECQALVKLCACRLLPLRCSLGECVLLKGLKGLELLLCLLYSFYNFHLLPYPLPSLFHCWFFFFLLFIFLPSSLLFLILRINVFWLLCFWSPNDVCNSRSSSPFRYADGKTNFIGIENAAPSATTSPLLISTDLVLRQPLAVMQSGTGVTATVLSNGLLQVSGLEQPGSYAVIYPKASAPPKTFQISPAPANKVSQHVVFLKWIYWVCGQWHFTANNCKPLSNKTCQNGLLLAKSFLFFWRCFSSLLSVIYAFFSADRNKLLGSS